MAVFKILSKFKEEDNHNIVTYKGKDLTTLSRAEIIQIADSGVPNCRHRESG